MSKFTLSVAAAAGYVLGARAGRHRYEQIASASRRVWRDPRVQRASTQVQDRAAETVRQAAPAVKDAVKDKVTRSGSEGSTPPPPPPPTSVTPPVSPDQAPTASATATPPSSVPVDDSIGGPA